MTEPMTDERRADIRERAESVRTWKAVWGPPIPQLCDVDIPDLLTEVEQLREALATVKIRSIQRDLQTLAHTALYGTAQKGETHG